MFDTKCICSYFEAKCLVLGTTPELVADDFWFAGTYDCPGQAPCSYALDAHWPGRIHKSLANAEQPDDRWLVGPTIKLVDICMRTGLVPSKNEFRRKVEQKGIKFDGKPVTDPNMEVSATGPLWTHEIRLGMRYLEIVVNFTPRENQDEISDDGVAVSC